MTQPGKLATNLDDVMAEIEGWLAARESDHLAALRRDGIDTDAPDFALQMTRYRAEAEAF